MQASFYAIQQASCACDASWPYLLTIYRISSGQGLAACGLPCIFLVFSAAAMQANFGEKKTNVSVLN